MTSGHNKARQRRARSDESPERQTNKRSAVPMSFTVASAILAICAAAVYTTYLLLR